MSKGSASGSGYEAIYVAGTATATAITTATSLGYNNIQVTGC